MYYLTPEAMQEELALLGTPSRPKEEDRLDDMLGIVDIAGD